MDGTSADRGDGATAARGEDGGGFAEECRVAVEAAEAAGALLRSRFLDAFRVDAKGPDGDVVTELDLLAEELVTRRLAGRFPGDRIRGEEGGEVAGPPGSRRTWLVDPLDGSNNVVVGLPAYVVGIALCVDGEPVLGVVHDPVAGRTWRAVRGAGAYGPGGRLRLPVRTPGAAPHEPAGRPVLGWTQGHGVGGDPVARALRDGLEGGARRVLQLWAPLLTWALLAGGLIDGFVGYRAEEIDLPAGCLLATEAGVAVRGLDGGPFSPRTGQPETARSYVAGRPELLPYLLDLVAGAR
ncbi:inositol monophosphatase family protein [Kitasatospora purpeofusca]|uniref:inositol monophosphatase family protein n=1 Tax=Kitasatospora purpeofusca TaxID=67352 RepID=UPI00369DD71A